LIGKDEEGNGLVYYDVIYGEWPGRSEEGYTKLRGTNYFWPRQEPRIFHFL
jgi:hypothetical protein